MGFSDNLLYIRQYYGVTQEAMAEQLGVSRQTVSKWEADINFPETDKLLMLCDLYDTSLDDLMRGSVKLASSQDTARYDRHMNRFNAGITALVVLVLLGLATLFLLEAFAVQDNLSTAVFLCFVVVGVVISIISSMNHAEFKRKNPLIDPSYSDDVLDRAGKRFAVMNASGVGLILIDVIMLVALSPENEGDSVILFDTILLEEVILALFMFALALAVGMIVFAAMQKAKYDRSEISYITKDGAIIRKREAKSAWTTTKSKTPQELRRGHVVGSLCGIIMIGSTIAFFVIGFSGGVASGEGRFSGSGFEYSWVSFIVGGLLCAIAAIAVEAFMKSTDEIVAEARNEDPWIKIEGQDPLGSPDQVLENTQAHQ